MMIAFGAVLGKATPTQILWLSIIMVPIYVLNQRLVFVIFKALDVGGSITIHVFGAYFGLAAGLIISRHAPETPSGLINSMSPSRKWMCLTFQGPK